MTDFAKQVENILAVYALASDYEKNEGENWYRGDAWQFCMMVGWQTAAALGQLTQEMDDRHWSKFVAAVVSVMSPQKEWRVNKSLAYSAVTAVIKGEPVTGHYGAQCAKVVKLYQYFLFHRGVAFSNVDVLNIIAKGDSYKTKSFYMNIIGEQDCVTVDGHAANIAEHGVKRVAITDTKQPKGLQYMALEQAYQSAAKRLGITPAVLQATTWVTYRRLALAV